MKLTSSYLAVLLQAVIAGEADGVNLLRGQLQEMHDAQFISQLQTQVSLFQSTTYLWVDPAAIGTVS